LATDVEIPYLGFGAYLIADGEVAAVVSEAIRVGYRHIDTAEVMTMNRASGPASSRHSSPGG
jgi:diketogulonate reductase-like aldo/keto reductase